MVKAHMQAPNAKKSASNFNPIGVSPFIERRFSASSLSGCQCLPLIVSSHSAFCIFILPLFGLR